jgi:predicted membrane protein
VSFSSVENSDYYPIVPQNMQYHNAVRGNLYITFVKKCHEIGLVVFDSINYGIGPSETEMSAISKALALIKAQLLFETSSAQFFIEPVILPIELKYVSTNSKGTFMLYCFSILFEF